MYSVLASCSQTLPSKEGTYLIMQGCTFKHKCFQDYFSLLLGRCSFSVLFTFCLCSVNAR